MLPPAIKQRVRESFDRAASTYDGAARVQRHVCNRLLEKLLFVGTPAHVLDSGCGTGYGAQLLRSRWPEALITGVDFAPAMLNFARHEVDAGVAADIEKLPFAAENFDLWWSSLSLQWCDADSVFAEASRVLKPTGQLALSTLGPNTFHELRAAFSDVDQHRHTLPFSEPDAINESLRLNGFKQITLLRETHTFYYPDLKTLLRALKAIGANNVGEGMRSGMMGHQAWKMLENAYEQHRESAGLPASYDVIFGYASK